SSKKHPLGEKRNHPGSKLRQGFWMVFRFGVNNWGLEYAAADSISKSQLSRFERGENEISLSTFFELLSNINVSIENFCNHLEHYKRSERDDFLVNLSPNFYSLNIKGLEVIKNKQQKLFEKSGKNS
ncbi:helix-turn-helix domain-containing protein, partial [Streptococcus pneumoniae]